MYAATIIEMERLKLNYDCAEKGVRDRRDIIRTIRIATKQININNN
jgi:hypothetical protein